MKPEKPEKEIQSWRYKTIVVIKHQQQTTISNKHSCSRPDEVDCTVNETLAVFVFTFCFIHQLNLFDLL